MAELLASGLTYQQAADALFVSPKTVQWNVSKIYRKLGITLARRADQAPRGRRLGPGPAGSPPAGPGVNPSRSGLFRSGLRRP